MKTILLSGGSGFIGSNFIRHVLTERRDWTVVNLDALTYAGNPLSLAGLEASSQSRYCFYHGDIRDRECVENLFRQHEFSGVFHFAAESHVDRSIIGPEAFVETNVMGTFRLLEAVRSNWETQGRPKSFRFLHVSTDEVYGSLAESGSFKEETPYDPSSPYSASKAASNHFAKAYFRTYRLPVLITNCSNNYGPYQFPEKLIPLTILNILEQKPLPVYGDGRNIRDWLFVTDHCEALLKVFENGRPGETYNIGGGAERENIQVVRQLCRLVDQRLGRAGAKGGERLIRFVKDRPGHDRRYAINSSRIRNELGWSPRHNFEQALERTVDWYLANLDWVNSVRSGEYRRWIEENYTNR